MGICPYCGQSAGWLSKEHSACVQKAEQGIEALKAYVADAVLQSRQYGESKVQVDLIVADAAIPQEQVPLAIKEGWSQGAEERSIAQPISDVEFSTISDFYRAAGLQQAEMQKTAGFRSMAFSFLIWTILHDQIDPDRGPIQFNLQAGEVPVFGMANVLVREDKDNKLLCWRL